MNNTTDLQGIYRYKEQYFYVAWNPIICKFMRCFLRPNNPIEGYSYTYPIGPTIPQAYTLIYQGWLSSGTIPASSFPELFI